MQTFRSTREDASRTAILAMTRALEPPEILDLRLKLLFFPAFGSEFCFRSGA
jgi:hypothetical protein